MKTRPYAIAASVALVIVGLSGAHAQGQSSSQYRRSALMNANQVRTVFGNWGVIAQPATLGHRGAWRNDNDGYIGDVSIFVGAEITWQGTTFHSVATCPVDRPTQLRDQDPNGSGKYWTLEPVNGYFNANETSVAISNDPTSWPPFWPDRLNDPNDPGWRTNPDPSLSQYAAWNGYFGKKISADLETYFVMDDNNDERFNQVNNNVFRVAFKPDSTNPSRNGMGLQVGVRAQQWAQFLAKDNIFWLYEVTNTGTTNYAQMVFGMLVGTYVGVTSTEDYQEYSDDWSFYDPKQNLTYTGDFKAINGQPMKNPLWVGGCGLVGYAYLESPGNPYDGIDNDGDADSSSIGRLAPKFTASDFDSVLITPGKQIVLINDDFSRTVYTVPNVDSVKVYTRGLSTWIYPGKTKVAEGNIVRDPLGNPIVNPNAYDGVDNNFNGLIDENYFVHYEQVKKTRTTPPVVIFDIVRPLAHVDYIRGLGTSPYSMIDESRSDLIDNNLNWDVRFDDVGRDGIAGTHDFGEGDGLPTSGYDANHRDTGLPGEPHIDKTDVNESDQIGLTSFYYFSPSNSFKLGDKEALWTQLKPGFFDVPDNISFDPVNGGRPTGGSDGDFIYGSGYFPLLAKATERFSLALVYGGGNGGGLTADLADLKKNKQTVQAIYNANYQFPQPPNKPTVTAVTDDHQVTLYWDRRAEETIDPVLRTKTFEGYKIYKSTDPNFSDIFTVTDANGAPQGYKALAQFDLVDGIKGYFQALGDLYQGAAGFTFYLGGDNGLQHTYVDKNVDNGRRYYYAVVAYTRGDATIGIYPAENTHQVSILPSGQVFHDINVAVVVPNAKTAGYIAPANGVALNHTSVFGSGAASYAVVDPTKLKADKYRVEFFDTQIDSLNASGKPVVSLDSTKWTRLTTVYNIRDMSSTVEQFTSLDTAITSFSHKNLVASTVVVHDAHGNLVPPANYLLNATLGSIRSLTPGSLPPGTYSVSYQYYPVYRSPNIQGTPFLSDSRDADNFDGLQIVFANNWSIILDTATSRWTKNQAYTYTFSPLSVEVAGSPPQKFQGYAKPADYAMIFSNKIVDTSYYDANLYPFTLPVNFRIYNQTDSTYVKFIFADNDGNGVLSALDEIVILDKNPDGRYGYTWDVTFARRGKVDSLYNLGLGDTLLLRTLKPFRYGDLFEFTPVLPTVDDSKASAGLLHVRVVPNPYVAAASFEQPLPPGITSGRGERKIEFIHIPRQSTIKIFTSRGDYVTTLHQDGNIEDGSVSWNLRTYENLDVAYGIYFYVVESPVGNKTGKIAIIK
jgi:hypothetical protein